MRELRFAAIGAVLLFAGCATHKASFEQINADGTSFSLTISEFVGPGGKSISNGEAELLFEGEDKIIELGQQNALETIRAAKMAEEIVAKITAALVGAEVIAP